MLTIVYNAGIKCSILCLCLDNFTCYPYQIRIKLLHIPISHLGFYINTNNCLILTCKQCKVTSNIRLGPNHDVNSLKQIIKHCPY